MIMKWMSYAIALVISAAVAAAQNPEYLVGPQDVLTVTVWNQPDLSGKFTVEADGTFSYPLIGRVPAKGQTLRRIETELHRRLSDGFLKNPQISVAVESSRSQRVFVVGDVRSPGAYPVSEEMTLIEALALAGSQPADALGEAVIVRAKRPASNATEGDPAAPAEIVRIQLSDLEAVVSSRNVQLFDGDTIFVSRAPSVYVFGQVRTPGAFRIPPGATVMQVLSLAGGVTDRGSTGRIKIVRTVDGKRVELKATLNDAVMAGDTVIVQERLF
jgi:polysaccharide biosynthesis/export protein